MVFEVFRNQIEERPRRDALLIFVIKLLNQGDLRLEEIVKEDG